MGKILYVLAVVVVACGLFLGVRYIGAVVHYTCAVPGEDCPPPFYGAGEIAFYITGGELNPLFTR